MILKKGDKNTAVKEWQAFLVAQEFNITADGAFGPATEAATRQFQKMCVLREDGIVGDATIQQAKLRGFKGFSEATGAAAPTLVIVESYDPRGLLSKVHPELAAAVKKIVELAKDHNFDLRVTQGLRTFAEQDLLYSQGRGGRKGPTVTNARGGQSWHNFGLAVDLAFVINGEISWDDHLYEHIGAWATAAAVNWGGSWKHRDLPHIQLPAAASPDDHIRSTFKAGGLDAVWKLF